MLGRIAKALAAAGSNIVLHGLRDDDYARQTRQSCLSHGVRVDWIDGDLMLDTAQAVTDLTSKAVAANPSIDLLVNNAGAFIDKPFLEMDFETYERTFRLNVAAGYFLSQFFAKRWIASRRSGASLLREVSMACFPSQPTRPTMPRKRQWLGWSGHSAWL